jgi:hypothetical protein
VWFCIQTTPFYSFPSKAWQHNVSVLGTKTKAKAVPLHATKAHGGEEVQLLLILETRWGWVVSVKSRPRFSPGERTPGTQCTGGWVGPRAGLDKEATGKILSPLLGIELRSPGHPARSQTLHWLSYPAHTKHSTIWVIGIERFGRVVNIPASYSGGPGLKIFAWRPAILKDFVVFLSPSKCWDSTFKSGQDRSFHIVSNSSLTIRRLIHNLSHWKGVIKYRTNYNKGKVSFPLRSSTHSSPRH